MPPLLVADPEFGLLGGLEDALDRLSAGVGVPALAASEAEFEASLGGRLTAVRARLWRLGYLTNGQDGHSPDAELRKAVRAFQRDAAGAVDGWVGPETWGRLQELVSLEKPTDVNRWLDKDGELLPALVRALRLRLSMLGVFSFAPDGDPAHTDETLNGLSDIKDVALAFGWLDAGTRFRDVAALVLDHRRLARGLSSPKVAEILPVDVHEDHGTLPLRERVLARIVQWDLWLSGIRFGSTDGAYDFALPGAIGDFWDTWVGPVDAPHGPMRRQITPSLVEALALDDADPEDEDRIDEAELEEALARHGERVAEEVDRDREHGFFLWEAAGRAIRWLAGRVRWAKTALSDAITGARRWAGTALRNLGRWVFAKTAEMFSRVRDAIGIAVGSALAAVSRVAVPGGTTSFSFDQDVLSVVAMDGETHELEGAIEARTHDFERACAVLGAIAQVLVTLALATTTGGWYFVAMRIVRVLRAGSGILEL